MYIFGLVKIHKLESLFFKADIMFLYHNINFSRYYSEVDSCIIFIICKHKLGA